RSRSPGTTRTSRSSANRRGAATANDCAASRSPGSVAGSCASSCSIASRTAPHPRSTRSSPPRAAPEARLRSAPYADAVLNPERAEEVLARLGFADRPAPDRAGLDALYLAWCHAVPFDNLVKRIHLASGSADPIPNGPADAFFAAWLRDGTGGT